MALHYIASGEITPNVRYQVIGGTNIEYPVSSGTFYLPGEYFVGISGSTTFTETGGAQVTEASQVIEVAIEYTPLLALVYPEGSQVIAVNIELQNLLPVIIRSIYRNSNSTY